MKIINNLLENICAIVVSNFTFFNDHLSLIKGFPVIILNVLIVMNVYCKNLEFGNQFL